MGPDFRVLVRKSRKQAEQYHKLYKVQPLVKHDCFVNVVFYSNIFHRMDCGWIGTVGIALSYLSSINYLVCSIECVISCGPGGCDAFIIHCSFHV